MHHLQTHPSNRLVLFLAGDGRDVRRLCIFLPDKSSDRNSVVHCQQPSPSARMSGLARTGPDQCKGHRSLNKCNPVSGLVGSLRAAQGSCHGRSHLPFFDMIFRLHCRLSGVLEFGNLGANILVGRSCLTVALHRSGRNDHRFCDAHDSELD